MGFGKNLRSTEELFIIDCPVFFLFWYVVETIEIDGTMNHFDEFKFCVLLTGVLFLTKRKSLK